MNLDVLLLHLGSIILFGEFSTFGFINQEVRKCEYTHVKRIFTIRCLFMNLKEVPQYLKTSVECLDLSNNRIRRLRKNSFARYTSIKYLLLYENMILTVEPGTFEHLTDLEQIDLSNNGLTTIPMEILQLPSLRNLYIDSNELINLESDLKKIAKPIQAPLEYINVADCSLQNLPDLGVLPKLWQINASMNPLQEISIDRFANWCNLKSIDLTRTTLDSCTCQQINNHLRYLNVKMEYAPICPETLPLDICPHPFNKTIGSPTFQSCKTEVKHAAIRKRWMVTLSCCLGASVLVVLILWGYIHKSRKRRKKKEKRAALRSNRVISPKNVINNKDYTRANNDSHDLITDHDKSNHQSSYKNNALLSCDTA